MPSRPPGFLGPRLTELVVSHREDGSALVRITADSSIEGTDVRYLGARGAPPRHVLAITGVGLPGDDALLPVHDGLLCEIEVVSRTDGPTARTELIFFLASSEVTAERAAIKGAHAVVLLLPPADPKTPRGCEVETPTRIRSWRFTAAGLPQEMPGDRR